MKKYIKPITVWAEIDNKMPLAASPTQPGISPDPAGEDSSAKDNAGAFWDEDESADGESWDRF